MRRPTFQAALTMYAGLALLALVSLTDPSRTVVVVAMAGFALKTWIGHLRERQEADAEPTIEEDPDTQAHPKD